MHLKTIAPAGLALLCAPALSLAACDGDDMLSALARDEPAALAAIEAKAAAMANGQGRFWRVERPGTEPSHLFGTLHSDSAVPTVPDAAWEALDAAHLAVFELHPDETAVIEARMAEDPQMAFDPAAPPLSTLLDPESITTVRTALTRRGVPGVLSEQMRPWMLFSLLSLPACEIQAMMLGAKPLDEVMGLRADAAGTPLRGLETFDDVMASFDRIGPDALLALLVGGPGMLAVEEDAFTTSLGLYADGRVAEIAALSHWLTRRHGGDGAAAAVEAVLDELIGGRNAAWMPALEQALEDGGAFVAVGALHMPGADGLVEMLRARGWTVHRLD